MFRHYLLIGIRTLSRKRLHFVGESKWRLVPIASSAVSVVRRTKEISVRRVLGATAEGIRALVSGEAIGLVAVANVIAQPIAYFVAGRWLADSASRTPLDIGSFVLAALTALGAAILTVAYHSIRAASAIPAESLRYE